MPEFAYSAREATGRAVNGMISATDQQEALRLLSEQKLFPTEVKPVKGQLTTSTQSQHRVSSTQLALFYSQMADLLSSGVPLLRALRLIEEQSSSRSLQLILTDLREQVADGKSLAEAMLRHPKSFPTFVISLVEAGEEGSFLEDALNRLAVFVEHQNDLRAKVVGAMIYPLFVGTFGVIIVYVMVVVFVPQFQPLFDRMEADRGLPWTTSTLLGFSDLLRDYWMAIFIGLIGLCYGGYRLINSPEGKYQIDRLLMSEITIGKYSIGLASLFRNLAIARFCRVLGTLLQNGVTMLRSLQIAKNASGNLVLEKDIEQALDNIVGGKSLAQPLRTSHHFPPTVVEMIAVGEESNHLEKVLIEISDQLERKIKLQLDLLVRMLEPLMLLILAAAVLFIVSALLLPILQSSSLV